MGRQTRKYRQMDIHTQKYRHGQTDTNVQTDGQRDSYTFNMVACIINFSFNGFGSNGCLEIALQKELEKVLKAQHLFFGFNE